MAMQDPGKYDSDKTVRKYLVCSNIYDNVIDELERDYLLNGDHILPISTHKDEREALLSESDSYEQLYPRTIVCNVLAEGTDPEKWEYELTSPDDDENAVNDLIAVLKKMKDLFTGELIILMYEFDDHQIIYITKTEVEMFRGLPENRSALFIGGKEVRLSRLVRFFRLSDFYRLVF